MGFHIACISSLGSNDALEEFLNARNPKQQHSSKLESYLIKPIQVFMNNVNISFPVL